MIKAGEINIIILILAFLYNKAFLRSPQMLDIIDINQFRFYNITVLSYMHISSLQQK